jgi:CubicO group peptidase (beta-lactamase class C family)
MMKPVFAFILFSFFSVAVPAKAYDLVPLPAQPVGTPWPTEQWSVEATPAALAAIVDEAFDNSVVPGTRAVVVIHRGVLVAERYAPGFAADQKFLSQSMAKSVLNTLVGLRVKDGALDVKARAPVAEWQGDERRHITLTNLLQMSSGLGFNEVYFNPVTSDVLPMLFGEGRKDMGTFAAQSPLAYEPGTHWSYASGTTNLISRIVRDSVGGDRASYLQFMRTRLFAPIGMTSAQPEFDASGTFVGSSWLHATARDWARFGLFSLRGGIWEDKALLPEGWIDWSRGPLAYSPVGNYGAHFWLNVGDIETGEGRRIAAGPRDAFMASGHRGQYVVMVPSKDLVIVRLGRTGYADYPRVTEWMGRLINWFEDVER